MAEHQHKRNEYETTTTTPGGNEGAVESKDRGLFDFLGKKEEKKPKEEVMASEFEKVSVSGGGGSHSHPKPVDEYYKEEKEEEKKHGLWGKKEEEKFTVSESYSHPKPIEDYYKEERKEEEKKHGLYQKKEEERVPAYESHSHPKPAEDYYKEERKEEEKKHGLFHNKASVSLTLIPSLAAPSPAPSSFSNETAAPSPAPSTSPLRSDAVAPPFRCRRPSVLSPSPSQQPDKILASAAMKFNVSCQKNVLKHSMKMSFSHLISQCELLCLLLFLLPSVNAVSKSENYQTYIIHMDHTHKPESFLTHESWHHSILKSLSSSPADDKELLLYSYNHVMHGFSARLTPSQLSEIEESQAHLVTYPESFVKAMTTYSPKFLRLQEKFSIWPAASYGEDVIVGVVDSGVWPESKSFKDEGMPPVPKKWKGKCENGMNFSSSNCSKKLIGARFYYKGFLAQHSNVFEEGEFRSPRDFGGHGTHTASTAVGNQVPGVSYFGYARGTAIGVAPRARLAVYKVLWADGSGVMSDVLAGMEQAILDGVDIMSLSLGDNDISHLRGKTYFNDLVAKGSLSAIEKGIFVVCAAGNDHDFKTVDNVAPWITTVGAGTLDRSFNAKMTLKNGVSVEGTSYFRKNDSITDLPLYYGKDIVSKAICMNRTLDRKEVAGKAVICDYSGSNVSQQIEEVKRAGASAAIITDLFLPLSHEKYIMSNVVEHSIPSLILPTGSGTLVKEYVTRVKNPEVKDMSFVLTRLGTKPAPQVYQLSSKGPNPIYPGVLKPDIIAPGVDVLAAVRSGYELMSGTSMATPHVAGVGALLKAIHPKWSPAAIRSAMMTTAYTMDNTGTIIKSEFTNELGSPLEFGAGHINPNKAMDPGLVYDMGFQDYIDFLCGMGPTNQQMSAFIRRPQWSCSNKSILDLNYPSFTAALTLTTETRYPVAMNFSRVVTNVGNDKAVYQAHLEKIPPGLKVSVKPRTLTFTHKNQTRSFVVNIELDRKISGVIYGFLKWKDHDDSHIVSSPIVAINFDNF